MALLFIDGFDHYVTAQITDKWSAKTSGISVYSSGGRFNSGYLDVNNHSSYLTKNIPKRNTVYFGAALYIDSVPNNPTSATPIIVFRDENGEDQIYIHLDASLKIRVYDVNSWNLLGTTSASFPVSTWFYLEVKVKIGNADGEVQIRINEQVALNLTGIDTKDPSGTDYIGRILLGGVYYLKAASWDDVYIDDAQFHGNVIIKSFMPDSDGVHSDWARSAGANDYECVDEAQTNEDTDYIYTTTKGHKSSFGVTTGALGTVKAIQVLHHMKAAAAGVRRIKALVRSGGSDYNGPVSPVVPTDYKYAVNIFQTDPQDGQPWNQTKLEAAEFGLTILDGTTTTSTTTSTTTTAP